MWNWWWWRCTWIIKKPNDFTDLNSVGVNDVNGIGGGGGASSVHKVRTPHRGNDNKNYCPNGAPGRSSLVNTSCKKQDNTSPSQCIQCYALGESSVTLENNVDNLENKPPGPNGSYGNGGGGGFLKMVMEMVFGHPGWKS